MNPLQPLLTKVFVEPINEVQSSQSNIKIPISSLLKGKVLFVGTTCTDALKPGQTVLYEKGQGNPFHHEGVDGLFFEEKQLISIL
jgi:co-chaperonin GroES (HSP10)